MSTILRIIGRLLFVVLLFSSAYHKIRYPEEFKAQFARGYTKIHSTFNAYGLTFLPSQLEFSSRILLAVKFVGLLEALIASFIVIGEHKGGLMALVYYVIYGVLTFTLSDFANANSKTFAQREKLVSWIALVGGSLLLSSRSYRK